MTRWPITFPWLAQFALAVAVLCALGFVLVAVLAVVRWWRARRAPARPGYVPGPREWGAYPNDWSDDWRS